VLCFPFGVATLTYYLGTQETVPDRALGETKTYFWRKVTDFSKFWKKYFGPSIQKKEQML